ncbi:MAG: BRCT domain-containing protein [Anaeroplasmataceae bacterium]
MKNRIKELEQIIINAKKNYYSLIDNTVEKEMSDAEYDILEDELRRLDPNNKVLTQVGYEEKINNFEKVVHRIPMLSIKKSHTEFEVASWYNDKVDSGAISENDLIIEPKIDGVSGDLYYEKGKLIRASTRGSGKVGYEIKSEYFNCIPKTISLKDKIHIRGEFYIPKDYSENRGEEPLRNMCAGAIKRKEKSEIHNHIRFVAYQIVNEIKETYDKESTKIDTLVKAGFDAPPYHIVKNYKSAWEYFVEYEDKLRDAWPYETDGLVIVFNSTETQIIINREFGVTDHHNKYCLAIKPKSLGDWSILRDIEWNTSRTGRIVPTGVINPILIDSVVINRATLNNITYIKTLDIKRFDKVYCVRSNDVIPKILKSIHTKDSTDISIDKCPSCGEKIVMKGVDYFCENYFGCPSQTINKFIHWFNVTGIKHIGPSAVDNLINIGKFYSIWQLYAMSSEDLVKVLEKFCNIKSNTNTMKEIIRLFEESKNQTEQEIIGNYGIPSIGKKSLEKMNVYTLNDLIKYKEIKYLTSDSAFEQKLSAWLNRDNRNFDDLFSLVKFINPKQGPTEKIKKKKFCITGNFSNRKRNSLIKEIENKYTNWEFSSTVSKETNVLFVGNENGYSSKSIAAARLSIPIVKIGEIFEISKLEKHMSD